MSILIHILFWIKLTLLLFVLFPLYSISLRLLIEACIRGLIPTINNLSPTDLLWFSNFFSSKYYMDSRFRSLFQSLINDYRSTTWNGNNITLGYMLLSNQMSLNFLCVAFSSPKEVKILFSEMCSIIQAYFDNGDIYLTNQVGAYVTGDEAFSIFYENYTQINTVQDIMNIELTAVRIYLFQHLPYRFCTDNRINYLALRLMFIQDLDVDYLDNNVINNLAYVTDASIVKRSIGNVNQVSLKNLTRITNINPHNKMYTVVYALLTGYIQTILNLIPSVPEFTQLVVSKNISLSDPNVGPNTTIAYRPALLGPAWMLQENPTAAIFGNIRHIWNSAQPSVYSYYDNIVQEMQASFDPNSAVNINMNQSTQLFDLLLGGTFVSLLPSARLNAINTLYTRNILDYTFADIFNESNQFYSLMSSLGQSISIPVSGMTADYSTYVSTNFSDNMQPSLLNGNNPNNPVQVDPNQVAALVAAFQANYNFISSGSQAPTINLYYGNSAQVTTTPSSQFITNLTSASSSSNAINATISQMNGNTFSTSTGIGSDAKALLTGSPTNDQVYGLVQALINNSSSIVAGQSITITYYYGAYASFTPSPGLIAAAAPGSSTAGTLSNYASNILSADLYQSTITTIGQEVLHEALYKPVICMSLLQTCGINLVTTNWTVPACCTSFTWSPNVSIFASRDFMVLYAQSTILPLDAMVKMLKAISPYGTNSFNYNVIQDTVYQTFSYCRTFQYILENPASYTAASSISVSVFNATYGNYYKLDQSLQGYVDMSAMQFNQSNSYSSISFAFKALSYAGSVDSNPNLKQNLSDQADMYMIKLIADTCWFYVFSNTQTLSFNVTSPSEQQFVSTFNSLANDANNNGFIQANQPVNNFFDLLQEYKSQIFAPNMINCITSIIQNSQIPTSFDTVTYQNIVKQFDFSVISPSNLNAKISGIVQGYNHDYIVVLMLFNLLNAGIQFNNQAYKILQQTSLISAAYINADTSPASDATILQNLANFAVNPYPYFDQTKTKVIVMPNNVLGQANDLTPSYFSFDGTNTLIYSLSTYFSPISQSGAIVSPIFNNSSYSSILNPT